MSKSAKKSLTVDDVLHIADLVAIKLPDDEVERLAQELTLTKDHIKNLEELTTDTVEPTYQTTGSTNRFLQEKIAQRTLPQKQALENARESKNGYFKIKSLGYHK